MVKAVGLAIAAAAFGAVTMAAPTPDVRALDSARRELGDDMFILEARTPRGKGGAKPKPAAKPKQPSNRPHGSVTDKLGVAVGAAGVATDIAGLALPKRDFDDFEELEARKGKAKGGAKPKPAGKKPAGKKPAAPKKGKGGPQSSTTDKIGVAVDAAGVATDVAGLVQGATAPPARRSFEDFEEFEARDFDDEFEELYARRGKGKAAPKPAAKPKQPSNRPHGSVTDKLGVAVDAAGVATDIAGLALPKRDFEDFEELEARKGKAKGGAKPKPAGKKPAGKKPAAPKKGKGGPQSSTTDKIGVAVDAAGVAADVAGLVQGAQAPPARRSFEDFEELYARKGKGKAAPKPKPAPKKPAGKKPAPKKDNRPHSSTTDKIGVAVDAAGVAADVAGLVQGAQAPPARRSFEDFEEFDARDFDDEFEELYARRGKGAKGKKPAAPKKNNGPGSSKTDKIGVAVDAAGVAAGVAGAFVPPPARRFIDFDEEDLYARDLNFMDELD